MIRERLAHAAGQLVTAPGVVLGPASVLLVAGRFVVAVFLQVGVTIGEVEQAKCNLDKAGQLVALEACQNARNGGHGGKAYRGEGKALCGRVARAGHHAASCLARRESFALRSSPCPLMLARRCSARVSSQVP